MTFIDFYQQAKNQPQPAYLFIKKIAHLTHRSEIAVRKWVAGKVTPDINVQEKLAKHFHVPMKELFPQEACQEEILEEA